MATNEEIIRFMRGFEIDHKPDEHPRVTMAQVSELCTIAEQYRFALELISGQKQCLDGLMCNVDIAKSALRRCYST